MKTRDLTRQTRPLRRLARDTLVVLVAATLSLAGSCDGKNIRDALKGDAATSGTILAAVSQVTADMADGVALQGTLPSGTASQFDLTLAPSATVVTNGGTALINATATSAFSFVYVGVEGLDAYYEIVLPAAGSITST